VTDPVSAQLRQLHNFVTLKRDITLWWQRHHKLVAAYGICYKHRMRVLTQQEAVVKQPTSGSTISSSSTVFCLILKSVSAFVGDQTFRPSRRPALIRRIEEGSRTHRADILRLRNSRPAGGTSSTSVFTLQQLYHTNESSAAVLRVSSEEGGVVSPEG
jgi:hypothetical protein